MKLNRPVTAGYLYAQAHTLPFLFMLCNNETNIFYKQLFLFADYFYQTDICRC